MCRRQDLVCIKRRPLGHVMSPQTSRFGAVVHGHKERIICHFEDSFLLKDGEAKARLVISSKLILGNHWSKGCDPFTR